MRAFLLAAGLGTRLRPLTNKTPKCLLPIKGYPLLGWWFDLLKYHSVTEVLVNTHYLAEQVENFIFKYNKSESDLVVHSVYEKTLLGSAGTLLVNKDFVNNDDFLICYADNLTNVDLTAFVEFHEKRSNLLSMALFHTDNPQQCGIVELDKNSVIKSFEEKPLMPKSDLANAGIYVANRAIFEFIDKDEVPIDLAKDVLPRLVGSMAGWPIKDYLIDIGTPRHYERAQWEWNYDHH